MLARKRRLPRLISRYRKKPGALIPLLQETQALFGYLPRPALEKIARALHLSTSQVYGVATFYAQFRLNPVGRNIIKVCHGTACHVAGAEKLTDYLEGTLRVKTGGTTADGRFTLEKVACLGCCSLSPVMMINDTAYGKLDPARVSRILKGYQ